MPGLCRLGAVGDGSSVVAVVEQLGGQRIASLGLWLKGLFVALPGTAWRHRHLGKIEVRQVRRFWHGALHTSDPIL